MKNCSLDARLSLTGRRWEWPTVPRDPEKPRSDGLPEWIGLLLQRRGVVGAEAVAQYLEPTLALLEDPHLMEDMPRAVERLLAARASGEPVVVFGDYDVDGVCATGILVEFLRSVGCRVSYYIPCRRAEGYGLNATAVTELAVSTKLLVTVDCGITAHAEIGLARNLGMDVIVVDHHQVPEALPPAIACLNPHRPDCGYPFKGLCAAGVAFMLAAALRRALREAGAFRSAPEPDLRVLLDMVALATVADMVPIQGTNRVLVAAGLKRLRQSPRTGLLALCAVAKVDRALVSATDLGFKLGPRINARGRMSQAGQAVELMLCRDPERARVLAEELDAANEQRRSVERATVEAAASRVEAEGLTADAALVLHDPAWHPGVLGLVASRLVARFHRPALVIGEGGKGSGRSVEGVNLHAALSVAAPHLERFGGHPAAAGVTVLPEKVPALRETLAAAVRETLGCPPFAPTLRPDLEVNPAMLDLGFVEAVHKLAPFGQGNPEPLFAARGLPIRSKRVVGQTHLKLNLGDAGADAIGFGLGALHDDLPPRIDALFHVERNVYLGRVSLQLRLQDLAAAEPC
ncbi:MAG TPA: single-stranded-DNA-specific exonuclease RecJ [Myxococcota bacterium]|nr:single-stranded-DNA-specific exonuclease RecJ [Myxococcota bacterium]